MAATTYSTVHSTTKTTKTKTTAHHKMKMPAAALKDPWKHSGMAQGQK